jgi:hypothetical protein
LIPLRIAGATHIMRAPADCPGVRDLHVILYGGISYSRWEPTPAELAILNAGGSVEMRVLGGQPPAHLLVAERVGYPGEADG